MEPAKNQLDLILVEIGEFGKYQILIMILLMIVSVIHSFTVIIYVFETLLVEHRCFVDDCDNDTASYNQSWLLEAVPFDDGKSSRCLKYQKLNSTCNSWDFNKSIIEHCNSFIYETKERSILQDFDLQCDENVAKLTLVGTLNGIGKLIGLPLAGFLSDRLGRKKILIISSLMAGVIGTIRSFSMSYTFFLVFEILDPFFSAGIFASVYVLSAELVEPKKRVLITTLQFISFSVGEIILGSVAWLVQTWRLLLQILYPLNLITVLYIWLIPESVRWLMVKNRFEEARKILKNIAKTNKKELSEEKISNLSIITEQLDKVQIPLKDILKSRILIVRCLICSFCWITCIFVYYGLTISSTTLSKNRYLEFIMTSAVEIPSYVVAHLLVATMRRKITLCASLFLCSLSSAGFIALPLGSLYWVNLTLYLISKVGISVAVFVVYIITNEIFPTSRRQTLLSICSMFGRIGNILAPQIILLQEVWFNFPLLLFAILSAISGILVLFLPETKDAVLPNTIEEAENIGKSK